MLEVVFLSALALIWLLFASVQDLKSRIVANWLSFSLITFVLGFRFFYSIFLGQGFSFFYEGIIGLGIFFILGNVLYHGRFFAGGDAKLFIALGPVLGFSENFFSNIDTFSLFFVLFLFSGAFYGLMWSIFLPLRNFNLFKTEFKSQMNKNKKIMVSMEIFALVVLVAGFFNELFFYLGILLFILPHLYVYTKSIDESVMIKNVKVENLEEGDLLYKNLKFSNGKIIKKNWKGLNALQIKEIRKKLKHVKIKEGIPFVPVFLISFILLLIFYFNGIEFGEILRLFY